MNRILTKLASFFDVKFSEDSISKYSHDEIRRIKLVNYIVLISMANMISYAILYCFLNFQLFKHAIIFLLIASFISFGIIFINKQGFFLSAKIMLTVFTAFHISYVSIFAFGKAPGFHIYLPFVASIVPLFLWNYKERQYPILFITIILIVYSIIEFFPPFFEPRIVLPEKYLYVFRMTNLAVCFLVAGIAIGFYQFLYLKKEEQLVKKAEQLKISQAHKAKVYSIIAHDLRSPFGAFSGLTELFINNYNDYSDEKRLKIIKSMFQTSSSLQNLLENLLDWSKLQTGTIEKSLKHINLLKIAKETLSLHQELILKREHKVELDIDSKLLIHADHHMVSTIFRNLISNAIKFTNQNGRISVSAHEVGTKVEVCVQDSGIGIQEYALKNLFNLSGINKVSKKSIEKGSGLGLILCKEFIESHEGEIWVESEMDIGSKFYFTLPKSMNEEKFN